MVARIRRQRLILPVAPAIGGALGCMVSLFIALAPAAMLEQMVEQTGIASVLAVAEPPLGLTARLVLMLVIGGGLGVLLWLALFLLFGPRTLTVGPSGQVCDTETDRWRPSLRRADAHPDAPARRPVFAQRDLGTPFLEVKAPQMAQGDAATEPAANAFAEPDDIAALLPETEAAMDDLAAPQLAVVDSVQRASAALVERDLPKDLEARLVDYDPDAFRPSVSSAFSPRLVNARRATALAPGERLETFELTPMVRSVMPSAAASGEQPKPTSIAALLERLERGVSQKAERPLVSKAADNSVQLSLASLSRIAVRG
ncbi:MAG: hypothetical protein ACKVOB_02020 [Sphingomonas sp.]